MANSLSETGSLAGSKLGSGASFDDPAPAEGPRLARIAHSKLYEKVYDELRNALMSGGFLPGESLTIRGVAEALGTSVMPVREALRRLAAERAVEMLANRTIRIPLMTEESFTELLGMRLMLEAQAAALAAERITDAELAQVRAANETFAALPDTTPADRLLANWQFHFTIYRAARSPLLLSVIEMFWLQSGPYLMAPLRWRTQQGQGEVYFAAGVAHHRALIEALARRDGAAASKALQADIGDAATAYREVLALREATARRLATT